jgi:hypothetical protein
MAAAADAPHSYRHVYGVGGASVRACALPTRIVSLIVFPGRRRVAPDDECGAPTLLSG